MKIKRNVKTAARKLFRACSPGGTLDESKLAQVVDELISAKPRNYIEILSQLQRLAEISASERTHVVESAVPLADEGASVFSDLSKKYGAPLRKSYTVNPDLLGGLRLRVGSNIWDYSVRTKLNQLQQALN